jgi:hypothetical protein
MQPLSTNSPLIKRARMEAVFMASSAIDRCVEAARISLEDTERRSGSVAMRLQLADALSGLVKFRGEMRTAFPAKLDEAFLAALDTVREQADSPLGPDLSVHDEDLALVEESEVQRFVEASRLQQTVMPVVEHALTRLDSLMSSALGLPVVRADLNPLRPDVLCSVLQKVIDDLPEPPEVHSHWARHMAMPFAQELNVIYDGVADMLEAQGVEEARYRLKLTEGGWAPQGVGLGGPPPDGGAFPGGGFGGGNPAYGSGGRVGGPGEGEGAAEPFAPFPSMAQLAQAMPAVSQALIRDFLYRPQWTQQFDEPLPPAYYQDVLAQAAAAAAAPIDEYDEKAEARERARERALSVVERPSRPINVASPLPPRYWGEQASAQARTRTLLELKTRAKKISQVLGLDAVRTLVSQVAGDARVLAPVREAFIALEPALLRAAMSDPRFFGDDAHPARRLVEEVAQRSFKYNDEFAPDFEAFMEPVREAVRNLSAAAEPRKKDFSERLQALQSQWQDIDQKEKEASEPGMQSVRFAQERQALADKIAWEFSLRSDLKGVPGKVADFLFRDWSLVIAHAQLTAERSQLDPGGYLAVVSDLLWSVKPEAALRQPARLFEIVPGLIATLRRGLNMLGKEPAETEAFFDALMRYHDPVLRLRRLRSAMDTQSFKPGELPPDLGELAIDSDPVPLEPPKPRAAEQPWLGPSERAAAGFHELEAGAGQLTDITALEADFGSTQPVETVIESGGAPLDSRAPAEPPPQDDAPPGEAPTQPAEAEAERAPAKPQAGAARHEHDIEGEEDMLARTRATLARLRTGDWVDLRVRNAWRRAQLVWTSDNGALFMFVSRGGRSHGMTRRTCEKLIRARYLRMVDAGAVVDKALRSLSANDSAKLRAAA